MKIASHITENLKSVQTAIEHACQRSKRPVQDVSLMAVTKYAKDEDVLSLLETGAVKHIGESRIQQAVSRWSMPSFARHHVCKHFIGHLQSNKAAQAAEFFDFIDSIDNFRTAQLLNLHAEKLNKQINILVQIKLTDRQTQSGIALSAASQFVKDLAALSSLHPCGYMAIAPQTDDQNLLRALFKQVKAVFDRDFPVETAPLKFLSLGMSEDFEIAVEEGSTLPRIGSKLFAHHLEE